MDQHDSQPSKEQFWQATSAFPEALDICKPTHLIATGITLWNDMPPFEDKKVEQCTPIDNYVPTIGRYRTSFGSVLAVGIPHMASYGFSPPTWSEFVREFLDRT